MMSQECIDNLNLAIDRARKPGACQYVDAEGPCCVIGQLAAIEGVPRDIIQAWDKMNFDGTSLSLSGSNEGWRVEHPNLDKYPRYDLIEVQRLWDQGIGLHGSEEGLKRRMKAYIR